MLHTYYIASETKRIHVYINFLGNIRVFCRCRPLSKVELSAGCTTVVDFDAAKDGCLGILTTGLTKKSFRFDRIYTPKDDQGIIHVLLSFDY